MAMRGGDTLKNYSFYLNHDIGNSIQFVTNPGQAPSEKVSFGLDNV